ncbi:MAG: AbrB/MazE/SpoVT family DNA-binding domain-containing protein [Oscillospiraceae bacterium]|nr:AbrB/MazE/SpoVT family DNA-binding domain-containing protein [Oscillospiraceae bacterium]
MLQPIRISQSMPRKRIAVSQKRQITIPIDFYNAIGVGSEVECFVRDNALVIRPVREESGAFDEEILADLISQGFAGAALLAKFKETRKQIRPAVELLLGEAALAADGNTPGASYADVFGTGEDA